MSRRQLALAAKVAPGPATRTIGALVTSGIVLETVAGNTTLISLNRDHLAAPYPVGLAGMRSDLIQRLREQLSSWEGLMGAWLFGSVARGDAGPSSDVDILLIHDDLGMGNFHHHLGLLQAGIHRWTGNEPQMVEHTPASWQQLLDSKNPLVQEIRSDGIALIDHDPGLLRRTR